MQTMASPTGHKVGKWDGLTGYFAEQDERNIQVEVNPTHLPTK